MPAAHPYVRAVTDPESVVLLPDPTPTGATSPGQWWPPRWLEPNYLIGKIAGIEVLHLHFGFDTTPPEVLRQVVGITSAHRVPLVVTVHDLHNPHFPDATEHLARLDVLVPAAAAVITLTPGAARVISGRWGTEAIVSPHPHVLPIEAVGRPLARRADPVVAVHAKSLRANIDPLPVVEALLDEPRPAWGLRLDVDDEVAGSPRAAILSTDRLGALRDRGVDVRRHARFTDAELVNYLGEIDVLVLPYRFGTHSGWVEACHDAGVTAVVPDCGFFSEQHGSPTYRVTPSGIDAASLRSAVGHAVAEPSVRQDDPGRRAERTAERRRVRDDTTRLYRRLLADTAAA